MQDSQNDSASHETDRSPGPGSTDISRRVGNDVAGGGNKTEGWRRFITQLTITVVVSATISAIVSGVCVPSLTSWRSPVRHIRHLIAQEAALASVGDVDGVVGLFAEDAFIKDAAGGNRDGEKTWVGPQEIRERYSQLSHFDYLKHDAIEITLSDDQNYARATAETIWQYLVDGETINMSTNSSSRGEKWSLEKVGGKWRIASFTYNLPQ